MASAGDGEGGDSGRGEGSRGESSGAADEVGADEITPAEPAAGSAPVASIQTWLSVEPAGQDALVPEAHVDGGVAGARAEESREEPAAAAAGGWGSVVQGLWSFKKHGPDKDLPHDDAAGAARSDAEKKSSAAASLVQDLWSRRPGLIFPHSAVPASDDDAADNRQGAGGEEEGGHIGGMRGLPKVGLVKLWNQREEIWNTVAEKAKTASVGGGTARAGDDAAAASCEPAETRVKLRNPLRFLGRDEWLSLLPLQVFDVARAPRWQCRRVSALPDLAASDDCVS